MGKSVRVLSATLIVVASMFAGLAAPASASSSARVVSHRHAAALAVPNTNLSGKAATAKFTPKKVTAHVYKKQADCNNPDNVSFTITNATNNKYKITYNGAVALTITKQSIWNICFSGPPGTVELGIKGSTKTLTVKLVKK